MEGKHSWPLFQLPRKNYQRALLLLLNTEEESDDQVLSMTEKKETVHSNALECMVQFDKISYYRMCLIDLKGEGANNFQEVENDKLGKYIQGKQYLEVLVDKY